MIRRRSIIYDLAIALGVLILIFTILVLWLSLKSQNNSDLTSFAHSPTPPESPPSEKVTPVEKFNRHVVGTHKVSQGDSFSLITGMYWQDIYLWPDLYIRNKMRSEDPDLIFPQEIVKIYNRLGKNKHYSEAERKVILDAYIQVYDQFKSLGPHKNDSVWTLLWSGAKYDKDFLSKYAHRIQPKDKIIAEKYLAEEIFLD